MGVDSLLDDRQQSPIVAVSNLAPERQRHLLPDHGGHRQRLAHVLAEPLHPSFDDLAQKRRHDDALEFAQPPAVIALSQTASSSSARSNSVAKNGLPSACCSR